MLTRFGDGTDTRTHAIVCLYYYRSFGRIDMKFLKRTAHFYYTWALTLFIVVLVAEECTC